MRRLIAALAFLLLGATGAAAQGCGNNNPNCIVPTAPTNTDNNQAASTAFVQNQMQAGPIGPATFPNDVYFGSGRPWCDVRAKGAKGDSTTDDTAAFQACVTQLTSGSGTTGGILYVPPAPNGQYCLFSGLSVTTSFSIEILGSSYSDQTELSTCSHDVTLLTLNNAPHSVRNIGLQGPNNINTTHDTLSLGAGCGECLVDHVGLFAGRYTINVAGSDVRLSNIKATSALGGAIIYTTGSLSCNACKLDTAYPVSSPTYGTTFSAWAPSNSYSSVGTVVSTAGSQGGSTYLIQLKTAGTSGSSAPTLQTYGTNITDGSAVWQLVGLQTNAAVQCDTGCSTLTITNRSDLSGAYTYGLYLTGNAQTVLMSNSYIGGWYSAGVFQNSTVGGVTLVGNQIQNCINTNCQGVYLHAPGDAEVIGNQFFGVGIGVEVDSTIANVTISSNFVFGAHVAGVYIGGTASTISVTSNQLGTSSSWGTNAIGVDIAGSGTDYLTVSGNQCHGATTCISNSSSGTHNLIEYTPGQFNTASVGNGCIYFNGTNGLTCTNNLTADSSGDLSSKATLAAPNVALAGSGTGFTNLSTNNSGSSTFTATIQAVTDTVVDRATTDPLTNKTIDTASNTIKINGNTVVTGADVAQQAMVGMVNTKITGVNFNSATTDNAIAVTLPTGFTRFSINTVLISNASHTLVSATAGLFNTTGGSGAICADQALTVSSTSDATTNNAQILTCANANTTSFVLANLAHTPNMYLRVGTAEGAAATADVTLILRALP